VLKHLIIQNFALIEEMDVQFPGQLTIITGETGAGKSIFLEALGLALGKRADLSSLRNTSKKCIIEAEFDISQLELKSFFKEQELEYEPKLVLRREISGDGKSRCFLNDALVSLTVLKNLSEQLVDIHSQHQTLLLNNGQFQLGLMDAFAETNHLLEDYKSKYNELQKLKRSLNELEEAEAKARKDKDYYDFLFKELSESDIAPGLLNQLEEQSLSLENAEFIRHQLSSASLALQNGDQNLLSGLAQIKQQLLGLAKFGDSYKLLGDRAQSVYLELKDIGAELEQAEMQVSVSPEKLSEINQKLDALNRLLKKHNVKSEEELLNIKEDLQAKLLQMESLEEDIVKTKSKIEVLTKQVLALAMDLSAKRKKVVKEVEAQVIQLLKDLGMEHAVFKVLCESLPEPGPSGADQLRFLFSANKGEAPGELQKIASGGELSRLMLSLKALLAEKKNLPSIVFDEIDTGVSGEVADRIGNILSRMGKNMQVISITHLPQIASKGKHHLFVYKKDGQEKTLSHIKELSAEERTVEIAKMLSTGKPTESAIKNAMDLLKAN
jgi:DNA repair protein RecN (Recombination protein N)